MYRKGRGMWSKRPQTSDNCERPYVKPRGQRRSICISLHNRYHLHGRCGMMRHTSVHEPTRAASYTFEFNTLADNPTDIAYLCIDVSGILCCVVLVRSTHMAQSIESTNAKLSWAHHHVVICLRLTAQRTHKHEGRCKNEFRTSHQRT